MYLKPSCNCYVTFINSIVMCMFRGELYVPYVHTNNDQSQDGKYSACLISNSH